MTKQLRDVEKYRLLSPLDAETHAGLRADFAINGVQVPLIRKRSRSQSGIVDCE
jgi:hypothetical protein